MNGSGPADVTFLRRRNALWHRLRTTEEGSPEFEDTLHELQALIHWPRERVLAALGIQAHPGGHTTDPYDPA